MARTKRTEVQNATHRQNLPTSRKERERERREENLRYNEAPPRCKAAMLVLVNDVNNKLGMQKGQEDRCYMKPFEMLVSM